MMDGIAESVDEVPSSKRWSRCWTKSGYVRALEAKNDMESRGRLENIGELKTTILKYMEGDRGAQPFRLFGGDRPLHRSG